MTVAKSMVVKHLFSLMKTMDSDDGKNEPRSCRSIC